MSLDNPEPRMSEEEADRRLATNPEDINAMLAKADNRMLAGDHRAANAYYGSVGSLAGKGAAISREDLLRARDTTVWLAERFKDKLLESLDRVGLTKSTRHPRFQKSLEIMLGHRQRDPEYVRFPQMPTTYFYPDLPSVEFADPKQFAWREAVEQAGDPIRKEAEMLLATDGTFGPYVKRTGDRPQGDVHGLMEDPSWSTFDLTRKGAPVHDRITKCPYTHTAIVENVPYCDIPNRAPSIMYSLLTAGSRIPPHTGMINVRWICHLPLIVPGNGALRVGSTSTEWQEYNLMVFDDTVEHEAWNNSGRDRLVLIFDIWRPDLSSDERTQVRALFAAVDEYPS